jgi:MEMO1 family protein
LYAVLDILLVMLPRLRYNLDFFPSPSPEQPGLVIRDPFHYSGATLVIPPALVACLEFYDGQREALDLREYLVRLTGDVMAGGVEKQLTEALSTAGFLEDEQFARFKAAAERAFADAPAREPAHAGSGYPDDAEALTGTLRGYIKDAPPLQDRQRVLAIAAPHVSPFGGVESYRAAYSALTPADAERTFVILGTSHHGQPDRIGLTRKSFLTPFGEAVTDTAIVDSVAREADNAAIMEDYCHSVEHTIEFQVIFLQHLFGPNIRIVPILCGAHAAGFLNGKPPEHDGHVQRIFGALGNLAAREGDRLLWVLGVDMAHMGRRYGDPMAARANQDGMTEVERRDRARIARMESGDAQGFWELIRENRDDLKWCGSAPIYTFLHAVPQVRGELLHYQQWNIDEESVVSFAGMRFCSR